MIRFLGYLMLFNIGVGVAKLALQEKEKRERRSSLWLKLADQNRLSLHK